MNEDLLSYEDVAEELRVLAAAAAAAVQARPDLADVVLARSRSRQRRLRKTGILVSGGLVALAAVAAAHPGGGNYFTVIQPSAAMEPTVVIEERVVFNKHLAPQRGDVVAAHIGAPGYDHDTMSRVVALPGDSIGCPAGADGRCDAIVVNGSAVSESYLAGVVTDPFPVSRVPSGKVFLMGDNRPAANDSRWFGPVPIDDITGVAVRVVGRDGETREIPGAPAHPGPDDTDVTDAPDTVPTAKSTNG